MRLTNGNPKEKRRPTNLKSTRPTVNETMLLAARLSDRDKGLLVWLYHVRFATAGQIERGFFAHPDLSQKQIHAHSRHRLVQLAKQGLLAEISVATFNLPWTSVVRKLWLLDSTGLMIAETLLDVPISFRVTDEKRATASAKHKHEVSVAELSCLMIESGTRHTWRSDRLRWAEQSEVSRRGGVKQPAYMRPDSIVTIPYGYVHNGKWRRFGSWTVYVEVDMATEDDEEIADKLARYAKAFNLADYWEGTARRTLGIAAYQDRYILFACSDAERATEIQALIDENKLPGLALYLGEAIPAIRNMPLAIKRYQDAKADMGRSQ